MKSLGHGWRAYQEEEQRRSLDATLWTMIYVLNYITNFKLRSKSQDEDEHSQLLGDLDNWTFLHDGCGSARLHYVSSSLQGGCTVGTTADIPKL